MFYKDEIVTEIRRNREALLKEYGGIEGLHNYFRLFTCPLMQVENDKGKLVVPDILGLKMVMGYD
jgi:hypothetical protein